MHDTWPCFTHGSAHHAGRSRETGRSVNPLFTWTEVSWVMALIGSLSRWVNHLLGGVLSVENATMDLV